MMKILNGQIMDNQQGDCSDKEIRIYKRPNYYMMMQNTFVNGKKMPLNN